MTLPIDDAAAAPLSYRRVDELDTKELT